MKKQQLKSNSVLSLLIIIYNSEYCACVCVTTPGGATRLLRHSHLPPPPTPPLLFSVDRPGWFPSVIAFLGTSNQNGRRKRDVYDRWDQLAVNRVAG